MNPKRLVSAALLGVVTSAMAGVALAAPASAGITINSGCRFELVNVEARELEENNQDEVYLEIGDEYTNVVKFGQGESHGATEFGSSAKTTEFIPAGGYIIVRGWERDFFADENLGAFPVYCSPKRDIEDLDASEAHYRVTYDVVALP